MTVGDRTMVADRIGGGTFCKEICKTAKGGSLPMTTLALGVFSACQLSLAREVFLGP
jgi:hypothetical protein